MGCSQLTARLLALRGITPRIAQEFLVNGLKTATLT